MSAPQDRLLADETAEQLHSEARELLQNRHNLPRFGQAMALAIIALAIDREARIELAADYGRALLAEVAN